MKWSWQIARINGIDIKVHASFVLALLWGAWVWGDGRLDGLLYGAVLTILLFAMVLLHELGHALAARRYGIPVYDILLLPIGGLARLSRMPDKPGQELVVALAGPIVNLAMVLAMVPAVLPRVSATLLETGRLVLPRTTEPGIVNLAGFLLMINLSLLLFNMLPAFPMDGGRVLRALMAMVLPYGQATSIAVWVGRAFAVLFGIFGILTGNFLLAAVAFFIFSGAGVEGAEVRIRESLHGITATDALDSGAPVLPVGLPAHLAHERLIRSPHSSLAIQDGSGELIGVITRDVFRRKWAAGVRGPVEAFAEQPALSVQCATPLGTVRQRMAEAQVWVAAVYCGDTFAGLLDFESIGRLASVGSRVLTQKPATEL